MPVVASSPICSRVGCDNRAGNPNSARSRVADSIVEVNRRLEKNSDKRQEGNTDVYCTPGSRVGGGHARKRNTSINQQDQTFPEIEEDLPISQQGFDTPTTDSSHYKSPAASSRSSPVPGREHSNVTLSCFQSEGILPTKPSNSRSVEQWLRESSLPQFQATDQYEETHPGVETTLDVLVARMSQLEHKIEDLRVQQCVSARGGYIPKGQLPGASDSSMHQLDAVEVGKRVLLEGLLNATSGPVTPIKDHASELPLSQGGKYGGELVDINCVCEEKMAAIPGVSLRQATEIVKERKRGGEFTGARNLRNRLRLDQLNNPTYRRICHHGEFSMSSPRADDNILVFGMVLLVQAACLVLYAMKVLLRPNLFERIKTYLQYQRAPEVPPQIDERHSRRRYSLTLGSSLGV